MNFTDEGIVLKARRIGDDDRQCTILTASKGVIGAFIKHGSSPKNKCFSATAQLVYARFTFFSGRERYYIDEAECIDTNFDLRLDPDRLTLAQYFCELMMQLARSEESSGEFLRLLRGAFYYLSKGSRPQTLIKAAAEMRAMALAGFMPDLVMCSECGRYTSDVMYFSPASGRLRCADCGRPAGAFALEPGVLTAFRHTVYADMKKLFSFSLPEDKLRALCSVSEAFVLEKTERSYPTLDIYKAMQGE